MQSIRIQSNFELAFTFFCPRQRRLRIRHTCVTTVHWSRRRRKYTTTFYILHPNDAKSKHNITDSWISEVKTTWTLRCSYARDVRCCHSSSLNVRPKVKLVFAHCSRHHHHGRRRRRQLFRSVCLSSHKSLAVATFSHCIDTRHTWFRKRLLLLSLFIYCRDDVDDDADYACLLVE